MPPAVPSQLPPCGAVKTHLIPASPPPSSQITVAPRHPGVNSARLRLAAAMKEYIDALNPLRDLPCFAHHEVSPLTSELSSLLFTTTNLCLVSLFYPRCKVHVIPPNTYSHTPAAWFHARFIMGWRPPGQPYSILRRLLGYNGKCSSLSCFTVTDPSQTPPPVRKVVIMSPGNRNFVSAAAKREDAMIPRRRCLAVNTSSVTSECRKSSIGNGRPILK
jgi:hypothetical protein